ncbi:hypothetical protein BC826DRAFT_314279 [Russula brevipes]|nr:hypothetical protein BC826DRAFT_314279 [Russula brevipes]
MAGCILPSKPHLKRTGEAAPPNRVAQTAKFSRATICTMYRIITGHAFVGAYTQRVYPNHTPEQIACPCSEPIQTIEHVLMACPLYNDACRKYLAVNGRLRNIQQLFNHPKRVQVVLSFLSRLELARHKPHTITAPYHPTVIP